MKWSKPMNLLRMSLSASFLILAVIAFRKFFSSKMPRTVFLFLWMLAWCKLMIPIPTGFSVSVTNGWFEKMPDITTALSIPATAWRHLGQSLMKERVNHLIHMKEKFLRIFCPFYQSSL